MDKLDRVNEKIKTKDANDLNEVCKSVFVASCPICGRVLFKGRPSSYVESGCPKCGKYLKISFSENGFNVATI